MIDEKKIKKLMGLMIEYDFDALRAESGGEKISLGRNGAFGYKSDLPKKRTPSIHQNSANGEKFSNNSQKTEGTAHTAPQTAGSSSVPSSPEVCLPQGQTITSPFVGTFYRSPGPETAPFVEIGSQVHKGQSLCIVEAMKLMNEIECEIDGEIVAILAENGKLVEFGTPLFIIAP